MYAILLLEKINEREKNINEFIKFISYSILNKDLIKALGLHEAVIIGELCSQYILYWENTNQLVDSKYHMKIRKLTLLECLRLMGFEVVIMKINFDIKK